MRRARSLVDEYGEGANAAALTIQTAWRGHRLDLAALRWRALVDALRDAAADAADGGVDGDQEEDGFEAHDDDDDGLDTHVPVPVAVSFFPLRASSKIPALRISENDGLTAGPSKALPVHPRRRRVRVHSFAPDREGEFISPKDFPKTVLRTKDGKRLPYPAVVRSWLDAHARAEAAAAADAPRVRTEPAALHPLVTTKIASIGLSEGELPRAAQSLRSYTRRR